MEKCQVLTLDGGGIRGMFTAAILAHLEADLGVSITNHFDLVVGTSTGGIIAIALGLGISPREILDFYVEHRSSIFPQKQWRPGRGLWGAKYSARPLERALKERFGEKRLGHSSKRLVIPSFSLDRLKTHLYKTSHHERFSRDYKELAWEVARATSAAPTYFPAFVSAGNQAMLDGGLWANNPVMVGVVEAVGVLGVPIGRVKVLSLGTLDEIPGRAKRALRGAGKIRWAKHVATTLMAGQSAAANDQADLLLDQKRLIRCSPSVPEGLYKLDTSDTDTLIGIAEHTSRNFSPQFKSKFLGHVAPPFKPHHNLEDEASC